MCELQENRPDSSDCVDEEELLGFMPADTIDNDNSRRIQVVAEIFNKPFGDGIYLTRTRWIANKIAHEQFGSGGSHKVAVCSVYAPKEKYLNSWSKIYAPRYIFQKTPSLKSLPCKSWEARKKYLQALEATGVPPGEVFLLDQWIFPLNNMAEVSNLMIVSPSKFKDLKFNCAEAPKDLPHGEMMEWLYTDLKWISKLQSGAWEFANYKPTINIVNVDEESGEWSIPRHCQWQTATNRLLKDDSHLRPQEIDQTEEFVL
ncbi:hypothetical protein BKA69DRAFT_1038857 [Paraphysoderma sedebokerense]|nr:hypothetical protein BKA69DRAFT_1038857 [Paraphysoderma sedebokerense]